VHTLTIRFETPDALGEWFVDARRVGLFTDDAGVRSRDALDAGRSHPNEYVVSSEPGVDGYLVAPGTEDGAAPHADAPTRS